MIFDVIKVLAGKVKVCATSAEGDSYFISSIDGIDGDEVTFTDAVDGIEVKLDRSMVDQCGLTTYGEATVPTVVEIGRIQSNEYVF